MKTLKQFALMICAIVCAMGFSSCEDNTTEDFYTIQVVEMSEAYSDNVLLQTTVIVSLADYVGSEQMTRTERDAKIWLDRACEQIVNSWSKVSSVVTVKDNTWVMIDLVNSKNKVVKSKKVKFEEMN